jgi:hypothetical protein
MFKRGQIGIQLSLTFLGACPRIENLLRKRHFGQIPRPFSLNRPVIRLKCTENLTQNGVPSLRFLFSDRLQVCIVLTKRLQTGKQLAGI